jgi:hypothetical protein
MAKSLFKQGVLCLLLLASCSTFADCHQAKGGEELDRGYNSLYDLQFQDSQRHFSLWRMDHPNDPLGPVSSASSYLFQEFHRLGVLETELFTNDERFNARRKLSPDARLKKLFDQEQSEAERLAEAALARNPQDEDALLSKTLIYGLSADYAALIEKRNRPALSSTKQGRMWAEKLLAADPMCYDAYLALGAENYLLGIKPIVARWVLELGGARTNSQEGVRQLRITAEKGHYLKPFAKLLLAVAALRSYDTFTARMLLAELRQEFPDNPLYSYELSKLGDGDGRK